MRKIGDGSMLEFTLQLVRDNAARAITTIAALTAVQTALDLLSSGRGSLGAVTTAATVYANYTIVAGLLGELGLMPDGYRTRPFWAMLGLSILTGLGTAIGFVLLIVPGVILLVRWSLCVPVLIGEETGVFEAMARSWQETKGRFWPIFGVFVTIYVVALLAGAVFAVLSFLPAGGFISTVGVNLAVYAGIVIGWHASVAIYAQYSSNVQSLSDVFA